MSGAIHPLPHYIFTAWYLVKDKEDFAFTFKETQDTPMEEEIGSD